MQMEKTFDPTTFRQVMGTFATGVTVVTTTDGGGLHGMTANAFTSVSLEPPLILISVDRKAETHSTIRKTKVFGVNILRHDQQDVSRAFAKKGADINDIHHDILGGAPVLAESLSSIACELWAEYDGGDHTLFVGLVRDLRTTGTADPLLYFMSKYHSIPSGVADV